MVRLVLDLKTDVKPQVFSLKPIGEYGHRLVLDIYPMVPIDPLAALIEQAEKRKPGDQPKVARLGIIVIDAAALPFADGSFSSAIAVLVLHHLTSGELQDRAFAEIFRVLRPGGIFFAFEIQEGRLQHAIHRNSTFVPVAPASIPARLTAAGFSRVTVDLRRGGFRLRAMRARES